MPCGGVVPEGQWRYRPRQRWLRAAEAGPTPLSADYGIPIRISEVHATGTRLPDVFVVPSGSVLAGAALPRPNFVFHGRREYQRAWNAVLGVGVAPRAIAIAILSQARAAGLQRLPMEPHCDHISCGFDNFGLVPQAGRVVVVQVGAQRNAGTLAFVGFYEFPGSPASGPAPAEIGTTGVPPKPRKPARGALPATGDPIEVGDWTATVVKGPQWSCRPWMPSVRKRQSCE